MCLMRENLAFLIPDVVVVVGPAVWTPLTHTECMAVRWGQMSSYCGLFLYFFYQNKMKIFQPPQLCYASGVLLLCSDFFAGLCSSLKAVMDLGEGSSQSNVF